MMQNELVNGNGNSHGSRPNTPTVVNNLSMTEYSANPSPPRTTPGSPKSKVKSVVPEEFVLPNGYPDVCTLDCFIKAHAEAN